MTDAALPPSQPSTALAGARIRARRTALGLTQAELARRAEISPAYLNLIEHDRRRIGGRLLNRLAELLDMPVAALSAEKPGKLASRLAAAWAERHPDNAPQDNAETFSLHMPEWAAFCADMVDRAEAEHARAERLRGRAQTDPALSGLLHEVLTAASAVRSASAILHGSETLSPEWQARFRRNLDEDSRRLADGAAKLAAWLETSGEAGAGSPEAEIDQRMARHGYGPDLAQILRHATDAGPAAQHQAQLWAAQLEADAARLPDHAMTAAWEHHGPCPKAMATALDQPLALILRRLAFSNWAQREGWGLLVVDQSGGLRLARPTEGLAPPWGGATCPLLPVFEALRRPYEPIEAVLSVPSPMGETQFTGLAAAEFVADSAGRRAEASLLLTPVQTPIPSALPMGLGCGHCPRNRCPARRGPAMQGMGS